MKLRTVVAAALLSQMALAAGFGSTAIAQAINENQLSDPRVRQALRYAIDMETIAATLFEGAAIPAAGLLPKGPNQPEDLNPYAYDPDKARALLAEAGWDNNRVLDLVFYYTDQQTADFMAAIQAYWADVGVQMNYRLLEGDVGAQLNSLPTDPVNGPSAITWDIGYGARAALALQEYYNRLAPGRSPTIPNIPKMNELVAAVNNTTDPAEQREIYRQMEYLLNENLWKMPLYYQQLYAFNSDRIDRVGHAIGNEQYQYDWDLTEWTVSGDGPVYTNGAPAQFFEVPWQNLGIFAMTKLGYDTLLEADASLTPVGGELAESYSTSPDGKTVTLTLRDGITWHDGSPITAEDVSWSLHAAGKFPISHPVIKNTVASLEGGDAWVAGTADKITGIAIDGRSITLTFARIDPNVMLALSQFNPLPSAQFAGADPVNLQQHPYWQKPIGSGPYKIGEALMNDYTSFVPYEGYWGGAPKIQQIIALPSYDSDANLLRNAQAKRLDFGYSKSAMDAVALGEMEHMTVYPVDIPYTRMFWINQFPH